jgi:hypothetical protein
MQQTTIKVKLRSFTKERVGGRGEYSMLLLLTKNAQAK